MILPNKVLAMKFLLSVADSGFLRGAANSKDGGANLLYGQSFLENSFLFVMQSHDT